MISFATDTHTVGWEPESRFPICRSSSTEGLGARLDALNLPPCRASTEEELEVWVDAIAEMITANVEITCPATLCSFMLSLLPSCIRRELSPRPKAWKDPELLVDMIALTQFPSLDYALKCMQAVYNYDRGDLCRIETLVSQRVMRLDRAARRRNITYQISWPLLFAAAQNAIPREYHSVLANTHFGPLMRRLRVIQERAIERENLLANVHLCADDSKSAKRAAPPVLSSADTGAPLSEVPV